MKSVLFREMDKKYVKPGTPGAKRGKRGGWYVEEPTGKKPATPKANISHESAVSMVKDIGRANEPKASMIMEDMSDSQLQAVIDTAAANLYSSNFYQRKVALTAHKRAARELTNRKNKPVDKKPSSKEPKSQGTR